MVRKSDYLSSRSSRKFGPIPQPERRIASLLRIAFGEIEQRLDEKLRAAGFTDLTRAHFVIWYHMRPEGTRVTELAERAQMTKQSMGYIVDQLEAGGYVERVDDPKDGRAKIVRMAARGKAVGEAAWQAVMEIETDWAQIIGKEQMNLLMKSLTQLVSAIESSY